MAARKTSRTPAPRTAAVDAAEGRRADAARNITAILDAALVCLRRDPDASVAAIAEQAGVGRVTVYGHYPSREALVDAVLGRAVAEAHRALADIDLDGLPAEQALTELMRSSWQILDSHRRLLSAAHRHLPAERIRAHHDAALRRVQRLVARGQREGVFRTDLPRGWLVTCLYSVMHAAADEMEAGRLSRGRAPGVLTGTLVGLLRA
jgi:TetR/AcrR family transcriptional regulator, mexCD-oprJ operon repressor